MIIFLEIAIPPEFYKI